MERNKGEASPPPVSSMWEVAILEVKGHPCCSLCQTFLLLKALLVVYIQFVYPLIVGGHLSHGHLGLL